MDAGVTGCGRRRAPDPAWTIIPETKRRRVLADEFPGARFAADVAEISPRRLGRAPPPPPVAEAASGPGRGEEDGGADSARARKLKCRRRPPRVPDDLLDLLWARRAGVVVIVGDTGSGKTACLRRFAARWLAVEGGGAGAGDDGNADADAGDDCDDNFKNHEAGNVLLAPPSWDPSLAIVSQFGSPDEAKTWLGRIGLNTIPSWTRPYHVLSTGERFRADLARRLQNASTSTSASSPDNGSGTPRRMLLIDDFTSTLDRRTASCCAVSVSKQLRRLKMGALLIASNRDVLAWLQPDLIVTLTREAKPSSSIETNNDDAGSNTIVWTAMHNQNAGKAPSITTVLNTRISKPTTRVPSSTPSGQPSSPPSPQLWAPPESREARLPRDLLRYVRKGLVSVDGLTSYAPIEDKDFKFRADLEPKPQGGVVLRSSVALDKCTQMCDSLFDAAFDGSCTTRVPNFPTAKELGAFRVGYITGPSGSLKSVVAAANFGACMVAGLVWHPEITVLDHFNSCGEPICRKILAAVELNYERCGRCGASALSQGERTMAGLARVLASRVVATNCAATKSTTACQSRLPCVVVDEFTSFLDRSSALRIAKGVSALVRQLKLDRIVLVGCHTDVIAEVQPDWVFDCAWYQLCRLSYAANLSEAIDIHSKSEGNSDDGGEYAALGADAGTDDADTKADADAAIKLFEGAVAFPSIVLRVVPCVPSLWRRFRDHHYKTKNLSTIANTFVALANCTVTRSGTFIGGNETTEVMAWDEPVAMVSTIRHNGRKNSAGVIPHRAHRTVVLPSWQGLGIGSHVSDAAGELHLCAGGEYFGQTVHPAFGGYRDRSPLWRGTAYNHTWQEFKIENWKQRKKNIRVRLDVPRFIFSHQYVGVKSSKELESMRGVLPEDAGDSAAGGTDAVATLKKLGDAGSCHDGCNELLPQAQRYAYQRGRMRVEIGLDEKTQDATKELAD